MILKKIGRYTRLNPGDRIQLHIKRRFSLGETVDSWLIGARIYNFGKRFGWNVTTYDYVDDGVILHVTVMPTDPFDNTQEAGVITPAVIITSVIGLSLIVLSVSVYKVVDSVGDSIESPGGKMVASSVPVLAVASVLFVLYLWLRKK